MKASDHMIEFKAENLASSFYYYRIETVDFHNMKKMVLLK